MNDYKTRIERKQINSKKLCVDPNYQRMLNPQQVKKIVNEFNPLLVNPIKVSARDDGRYYVFDGQHTLCALLEMKYTEMLQNVKNAWGGDKDSLRAEIIGGMMFLYLNHGNEVNSTTLVRHLSKVNPMSIIRNAKLSTEPGKKKYMNEIVKEYNKGLKSKRL